MKWVALLALAGCALNSVPNAGMPSVPRLSFMRFGEDRHRLQDAIDCALARIKAASCLDVDISYSGNHVVRFKPASEMNGMFGWTTGPSWNTTRIAIRSGEMTAAQECGVLVHEIGQHVLRRSNSHVEPQSKLHEALLASICAVQECGCFNPEAL